MCADTVTGGPPPADLDDEHIALAAEVFTLLSDETRVRLILALEHGEMTVGALAQCVGRAPTAVSQHLAKLRWARVVATRQEGTRVHYRLVDEHARTLIHQAILQAEHMVDDFPAHHRPSSGRPVSGDRSLRGDTQPIPSSVAPGAVTTAPESSGPAELPPGSSRPEEPTPGSPGAAAPAPGSSRPAAPAPTAFVTTASALITTARPTPVDDEREGAAS